MLWLVNFILTLGRLHTFIDDAMKKHDITYKTGRVEYQGIWLMPANVLFTLIKKISELVPDNSTITVYSLQHGLTLTSLDKKNGKKDLAEFLNQDINEKFISSKRARPSNLPNSKKAKADETEKQELEEENEEEQEEPKKKHKTEENKCKMRYNLVTPKKQDSKKHKKQETEDDEGNYSIMLEVEETAKPKKKEDKVKEEKREKPKEDKREETEEDGNNSIMLEVEEVVKPKKKEEKVKEEKKEKSREDKKKEIKAKKHKDSDYETDSE
jgi:hypothetical protein